jgi:hypothetical protein
VLIAFDLFQASQLQVNTTETIEAVELEKKRHYSTRMEALARVAKLEVYYLY